MKKELFDLAQELLSRSNRFEAPEAERESFRQALEKMGTLEPIARWSMPQQVQAPKTQAAPGPASAALAPEARPAPRATGAARTSRREYEPALKDLSVVEALLELQNRKNSRPAAPAATQARPSSRASKSFATPEIPRVDVASESLAFEKRMRAVNANPVLRKPRT